MPVVDALTTGPGMVVNVALVGDIKPRALSGLIGTIPIVKFVFGSAPVNVPG
jgi:hypothetical protein